MPGPPPCPCIERKSSIRLRISSDIPPRVADGESERPVGPERRLVEPAPRELPDDDDVTTALSPMIVVNADFIAVSLCVPQKAQPDEVITQLMDETTHRSSALHPEWLDGYQPLWADGYYLVMPPRDLSDREIARFITYQRQAQIG